MYYLDVFTMATSLLIKAAIFFLDCIVSTYKVVLECKYERTVYYYSTGFWFIRKSVADKYQLMCNTYVANYLE